MAGCTVNYSLPLIYVQTDNMWGNVSCQDVLQCPIYFPAVTIYSKWMCKKSEATSQAKICACKIWWLPARHEISGSLKRQAIKSQCLFMFAYACTCMYGVCACTENAAYPI